MAENIHKELEEKKNILISKCLNDIKVQLSEEFDRNFEREAFFSEKWKRRKFNDDESRSLLMKTGNLRSSLGAEVGVNKVTFTATSPYAKIHNEGGEITVTRRMKGYFWNMYRNSISRRSFKRDGTQRNDKKNNIINDSADFYKAMALKKIGSKIIIPQRQFIGRHPDMEKILLDIITNNIKETFK